MSRKRVFQRGCITGKRWAKELDVDEFNRQYARAMHHIRKDITKISLLEAERRSGVCHQFWAKVERGETHPSSRTQLIMCNALRIRSHALVRLAEYWTELAQKAKLIVLSLLPDDEGPIFVLHGG